MKRGRIHLDYANFVRKFLAVPRCYKCQGYGRLVKYCKKVREQGCLHCGEEGHSFKECARSKEEPVCVTCKAPEKEFRHGMWTMDCPIYVCEGVERMVNTTYYNGK